MKTCFIIMPISTPKDSVELYNGDADHFLHVLDCLFIPAIETCGLQAILPVVAGSEIIHGEIIKNLSSSDLVLCDISQLNANVFFEFGIRTALNKPVALVTDDTTMNIPFDTGIINYHRYNSSLQGWVIKSEINKLSEHINKTLESEPDKNNLWKYFGISQTGILNTGQATTEDKFSLVMRKLDFLAESITSPRVSNGLPTLDSLAADGLPPYDVALAAFQNTYVAKLMAEGGTMSQLQQKSGLSSSRMYDVLKKASYPVRSRPKTEE
ncbi:MAG TPA: hypothetical protein VJR02_01810 [Pyrinomonadaceae bacterium]|nr:hypothetical protein [Pyrinomonadaceae bacterium]